MEVFFPLKTLVRAFKTTSKEILFFFLLFELLGNSVCNLTARGRREVCDLKEIYRLIITASLLPPLKWFPLPATASSTLKSQ